MAKSIKSKKSSTGSKLFMLFLIGIVIYCVGILIDQQKTISALGTDNAAVQERLQAAREENKMLKDEEAKLSDDTYIEKLAREELGMTRQGEIPYIYAENK